MVVVVAFVVVVIAVVIVVARTYGSPHAKIVWLVFFAEAYWPI